MKSLKRAFLVVLPLRHHLGHALAFPGATAAGFGAVAAVLRIVFFAFGGAGAARFRAQPAHLSVEWAFVRHEDHTGLAGRGAVKVGLGAVHHFRHSNTLGAAIFALRKAVQAGFGAGLHFEHCHRVWHWFVLSRGT